MIRIINPTSRIAIACALSLASISVASAGAFDLQDNGALEALESLKFETVNTGFLAKDGATGQAIDLSKTLVSRVDGKTVLNATGSQGLSLEAEFIPKAGYLLVNGVLKNSDGKDRAVILDYRVGPPGKDAIFSSGLNKKEEFALTDAKEEFESNAFPIGALNSSAGSVALAIPPDEPRSFGLVGNAQRRQWCVQPRSQATADR